MTTTGTLYIFSAPSGAGKTSLVKALTQQLDHIQVSVSHTTRAKRPGEVDGVDYHFVSADAFQTLINQQAFLEHALVFDHHYGTSHATIQAQLAAGRDVILEIDWQGAAQVRQLIPEAVSVFILPPSLAALEQRLRSRDQDSSDVIVSRLAKAKLEIQHYDQYHYLIVNDVFETALAELKSIVTNRRLRLCVQQQRHRDLIASLLA